jgi:hypothetical protein
MRRHLYRTCAIAVAALVSAVVAVPAPASAAPAGTAAVVDIPCPTDPNIRWARIFNVYIGVQYTIVSSTPTFYASDGRAVDNLLTEPISATFTATQTRTTTVTVTVGYSYQLTEKLQTEVSVQILGTRTTAIGVEATANVPPRTRLTGLYGIDGYDVVYDALRIVKQNNRCQAFTPERFTTAAPTFVEGWRFSSTPL